MASKKPVGKNQAGTQFAGRTFVARTLDEDEEIESARSRGKIAEQAARNKQRIARAQRVGRHTTSKGD
jgi:hypothetical protein